MPAPRRSPRRTTKSPASKPRWAATTPAPGKRADHAAPPRQDAPHYRFIGGKGGAGKTTCAAGIALAAAAAGRRTLLISTDPAPSLGDALARPLGAAPRKLAVRRGSLHAMEIDAARALERWLAVRRGPLERIALRGTWLDAEDVTRLLRLSLPGVDELAALLEITRHARSGRYDEIVVDTAPTGHTLRLLTTPEMLRAIARVFDHMQAKHRLMVEALRGGWTPDAEEVLIAEIDREGRDVAALLRDPVRVRMSWVTLPEYMAVEETADAAAALAAQGIPLHDIIVNRITPPPPQRCAWCDGSRVFEAGAMEVLRRKVPGVPLFALAARDAEPRGIHALARVGAELARETPPPHPPVTRRRITWRAAPSGRAPCDLLATISRPATRLLIFGGKGGVGKTTCAAAAAIAIARRSPGRRVLLLSSDPAHSLADVFGATVSDAPGAVSGAPPNLAIRELDAARGFQNVRHRYANAIDALFNRLTRGASSGVGMDAGHDRQVMHDLIDLAPPGIDELAAVIEVTDALVEQSPHTFDIVVMDTAPSGHALRLLEMPALVQDWARALMAILLKYQPVIGIGELGAVLLNLSQGIGRLRALLGDRQRMSFVAVTRAAALPRAETVRLTARLRRMHVHVAGVIVNATGRGTCERCRKAIATERRELARLQESFGQPRSLHVVVAPAEMPPPHGAEALRRWQARWR